MEEVIRVFIADASREYVELLQAALEQEEQFIVVGAACSGEHALAAIPNSRANLLITDLLLPGLDGLSLLRQLRAQGCLPHTIVVSGFYNDRIAGIVSGLADNYLSKPCRVEKLISHMLEAVRGPGKTFVRDYNAVVSRALIDCGIQPHLDGFAYLREGILRTLDDRSLLRGVTKVLYRDIAKSFSTTPACVERSIRTAIERAWEKQSRTERSLSFGHLFDVYEKAPSNVPFLTAMTEHIETIYANAEKLCK